MADYIDCLAAIKAIRERCAPCGEGIEALKNVPAADVAPVVHGRWIYGEDVDIQCSICGHDAYTEGDYRQVKTNYCPNCGAKMEEDDDD